MTEMAQGEMAAAVSTMSFSVAHGSDALDPASLAFDIATIQSALTGLTSHGSLISFSLDANGQLVGTTADGREILRAELSLVDNNGNWSVTAKVTLSGELDHKGVNPSTCRFPSPWPIRMAIALVPRCRSPLRMARPRALSLALG